MTTEKAENPKSEGEWPIVDEETTLTAEEAGAAALSCASIPPALDAYSDEVIDQLLEAGVFANGGIGGFVAPSVGLTVKLGAYVLRVSKGRLTMHRTLRVEHPMAASDGLAGAENYASRLHCLYGVGGLSHQSRSL